MKILIGVDDSPYSKAALDFVKKTPWPAGSKVLVLSVVRPVVGVYAEVYAPQPDYLGRVMDEQVKFHQELASKAEQSLGGSGLMSEARVLEGDPRMALVDTAREERVDLVVVGSHGRTGISKLVLGSVASHVVTHAPCSVLVVKQAAAAKA